MRGFGEEMARQGRIAKIAKLEDHVTLKCNVTIPFGLYIYLIMFIYLFIFYLFMYLYIYIYVFI